MVQRPPTQVVKIGRHFGATWQTNRVVLQWEFFKLWTGSFLHYLGFEASFEF